MEIEGDDGESSKIESSDPAMQKQKLEVVAERDGDAKRPKFHDMHKLEVFDERDMPLEVVVERDGDMQKLEEVVDESDNIKPEIRFGNGLVDERYSSEPEVEYGNGFRFKLSHLKWKNRSVDEDEKEDEKEEEEEEEDEDEDADKDEDADEDAYDGNKPIPFVYPGEAMDIIDLLFPKGRNCLVRNDGREVMADDLNGKTIVLYIVPLNVEAEFEPWTTLDMIDAYKELSQKRDVEFVFVGARIEYAYPLHDDIYQREPCEQKAYFKSIAPIVPFPTIPFKYKKIQKRVVRAFRLHHFNPGSNYFLPYWSIIDSSTKTVVASITDRNCYWLFQYYSGAELYPLTNDTIHRLISQSTKPGDVLKNLDQLLQSAGDGHLKRPSTGDMVPVSSLKGKLVGLYFCEDEPKPPYMKVIRKVYEEAKQRKLGFEIVQTSVRFNPITGVSTDFKWLSLQQSASKQQPVDWLTLPYDDPRHKKLLRIFSSVCVQDEVYSVNGCLVIVQPERDVFEFSGAEILEVYGTDGYPYTREHLFELEKKIHEETLKLNLLFPPGKCDLNVWEGDKFVLTDNARLSGKKVVVLLDSFLDPKCCEFVTHLASRYKEARHRNAKEDEFEVVYVSCARDKSKGGKFVKDMPWLVSYSPDLERLLKSNLFKCCGRFCHQYNTGFAAFGEDGELITKCYRLACVRRIMTKQFPFISTKLDAIVRYELYKMCLFDKYYRQDS